MAAAKSSYIQLYDEEEKKDDYKWQIECKQAGVSIKDSHANRPMKFYGKEFKFYKGGAAPGPGFDLESRLDGADSAASAAQSKADSNETAISDEVVDRTAAVATVAANLQSEINSRATAIAAVQADVDQNEADGDAARLVISQSVTAEASARAAAV